MYSTASRSLAQNAAAAAAASLPTAAIAAADSPSAMTGYSSKYNLDGIMRVGSLMLVQNEEGHSLQTVMQIQKEGVRTHATRATPPRGKEACSV